MLTCYAKTIYLVAVGESVWRSHFWASWKPRQTHLALNFLKLPSLSINLDGQDPSTGNIVIDLVLSSVTILHRSKI